MSNYIDKLASFVPTLLARRLAADPTPVTEPIKESLPAAVLQADISGLTTLSKHLIEQGPTGIEELTRLLNTYFGHLVYLIVTHNGDVINLDGNSLLALWPARAGLMVNEEEDLGTATRRSAQCALTMQQHFSNYKLFADIPVSLRLAVGTGQVSTFHLGGVYKRWEFLVSGKPLTQTALALTQAQPGDTVLSQEAWALVQDDFLGHPLTKSNVRLEAIHTRMPLRAAIAPDLSATTEAALQAYVPGAALAKLTDEQSNWLYELHALTVLFVNTPDLNYASPLIRVQTAIGTLQEALYHYEGSITKLTLNDQGVTLAASLGLPPLVHQDDAVRGVQAALMIQTELRQLGLHSGIGVSTGQALCGLVGSTTRRQYTMIGEVVGRAARLMQSASQYQRTAAPSLLCDQATYQAARAHFSFQDLAPSAIEDKAESWPIYQPDGQSKKFIRRQREMVGRRQEKAVLAEGLQALIRDHSKTVVIIEGEAGIGKSRLVEDLLRQAKVLKVDCLLGRGDAIEKSTPYYIWCPIFNQLFGLDANGPRADRNRISKKLRAQPELLPLAPLLNAVLPIDLPDNGLTAQMSGEVRANNTHHLLVRLLQACVTEAPTALILEDASRLDTASRVLLELVNREAYPLLLVVTSRPIHDPLLPDYDHLLRSPDTKYLRLEPLTPDENLELICQRLSIASLPEPVAKLIYDKTGGLPFFSEQLADSLRDEGVLEIANGQAYLAPKADHVSQLELPNTIEDIIVKRIERLTPRQQLVLHAASVNGPVFSLNMLHRICPIEADEANLIDQLEALEQLDFIKLLSPDPNPTYMFKHIMIQEATYNRIDPEQRQQLHRYVAAWYETAYADDLSVYYSLVAHHLSRANDVPKAIDYLEKAGQQALHNRANQEAIEYISKILALDQQESPGHPGTRHTNNPGQLRRASWERQLGEAKIRLGNLIESRQHFQRTLALLGWDLPSTPVKLAVESLRELLRQVRHRFWPGSFVKGDRVERGKLQEAAQAAWHLTRIYHISNQNRLYLYTSLLNLNLAEEMGSSPELARAYANVCLMTSLIPFHSLARRYGGLARKAAETLHEDATLARVLDIISIYDLGIGRWNRAQQSLEKAVEIYDCLGDRRRWEGALSNLAAVAYYQGQFAHSAKIRADVYASAKQRQDDQIQAWVLNGQAECMLRLGLEDDTAEAVSLLERAISLVDEDKSYQPELVRAYGLLAVARLRLGQQQRAREGADTAARLIAPMRPTTSHLLEGYASLAEVYLTLWKVSRDQLTSEWKDLTPFAQQACKALHRYARVFPIGRPRALHWQGVFNWLGGKPSKAHQLWRKSLVAAEQLAMPYEQGLAHFEIGQRSPTTDGSRREHLVKASDIFSQLDAYYELAQVQKAIAAID